VLHQEDCNRAFSLEVAHDWVLLLPSITLATHLATRLETRLSFILSLLQASATACPENAEGLTRPLIGLQVRESTSKRVHWMAYQKQHGFSG
jgi:hypothetical protein